MTKRKKLLRKIERTRRKLARLEAWLALVEEGEKKIGLDLSGGSAGDTTPVPYDPTETPTTKAYTHEGPPLTVIYSTNHDSSSPEETATYSILPTTTTLPYTPQTEEPLTSIFSRWANQSFPLTQEEVFQQESLKVDMVSGIQEQEQGLDFVFDEPGAVDMFQDSEEPSEYSWLVKKFKLNLMKEPPEHNDVVLLVDWEPNKPITLGVGRFNEAGYWDWLGGDAKCYPTYWTEFSNL